MADSIVMQLVDRHMATDSITIDVGYDRENVDKGDYIGAVCTDHYGRMVPKPAHGSTKLQAATNLGSKILPAVTELFDRIADKRLLVRRLTICAGILPLVAQRTQDIIRDYIGLRPKPIPKAIVEG